jgi:hypothetical protein
MAHRNNDLFARVTSFVPNNSIPFDPSWASLQAVPASPTSPAIEADGATLPVPATQPPAEAGGVTSEAAIANADDDMHMHMQELPSRLVPPEYVKVFNYNQGDDADADATGSARRSAEETSLQDLGRAARKVVNSNCADGGVLFRNLHHRIKTPEDFAVFWKACMGIEGEDEDKERWAPAAYIPFGKLRSKVGGVDLVTAFPPEMTLDCHNEMAYNPRPPGKIAFFCLQEAVEGGETIVIKNSDLSLSIGNEIQDLVKKHGGIMYRRKYHDRSNTEEVSKPYQISWQDKCGTEDKDEAIRFFMDIGFAAPDDVYFNDEGALIAKNIHSGFNDDGHWFNIADMGVMPLADGTIIPPEMLLKIKRNKWKQVRALKLLAGDWLVLNNLAVQHGRLPFKNSNEQKRTILTVYTE